MIKLPVIALYTNGPCIGAGLQLLMSADIRIGLKISPSTKITIPTTTTTTTSNDNYNNDNNNNNTKTSPTTTTTTTKITTLPISKFAIMEQNGV
eukprot:UN01234